MKKQKIEIELVKAESLGEGLSKAECYTGNVVELLGEFRETFIDPDTGKLVKVDFRTGVAMAQSFWDKVKETASECEGKEIEVKLPDGLPGIIIQSLLAAIGFRL